MLGGDLPEWATDAVHTDIQIFFDWKDRLRILFGAEVHLKVRTDCENKPGRVESKTRTSVYRLFPRRNHMEIGTVEAKE